MQPVRTSQDLDVATPERVALSLPIAGLGYRSIAYLVDLVVLFALWVVAYFVLSLLVSDLVGFYQSLSGMVRTLAVLGIFATQWIFWTACEVYWGGQTIGKRLLRIRVVREDGSQLTFLESAVRNLCRLLDFLPLFYAAGLVTMLVTRQNRRLGDLLAGTLLVREDRIDLGKYTQAPIEALAMPTGAAEPVLAVQEAELILAFLERAPQLDPVARRRLGLKLFARYGSSRPIRECQAIEPTVTIIEAALRARAQQRG